MKKIAFVLFLLCLHMEALGQSDDNHEVEIISHQVKQGETVRLISKKYLVTPSDIYKLNKFAIDGISQGMVLQIPVKRNKGAKANPQKSEEALLTEIEEVEAIQDALAAESDADGSADRPTPVSEPDETTTVEHKVLSGETLSGLARKYDVSVEEIKRQNLSVTARGLQAGQLLRITIGPLPENLKSTTKQIVESEIIGDSADTSDGAEIIEHTVQPKETLYSISKHYKVSVDEIKQQNGSLLAHGLQIGQVIKIKLKN